MVGMATRANNNHINGAGIGENINSLLEVCSSISPPGQKMHRSFVEDGLVLAVIGTRALVDWLGVGGGRIQTG